MRDDQEAGLRHGEAPRVRERGRRRRRRPTGGVVQVLPAEYVADSDQREEAERHGQFVPAAGPIHRLPQTIQERQFGRTSM